MKRGPADSEDPNPRPSAERILARRDHGREELRKKLLRRGFPTAAVEEVLEDFARRGLLDDGRFALEFARQALGKGHGALYIRAKLGARGLRVSGTVCTAADEAASLRAFLDRRRLEPKALTGAAERAKILRFLRGRGYSTAAIQAVLGQDGD